MAQHPGERHPPIADEEPDVRLPTELFEWWQRQPYVFELSHVLSAADRVPRSPRVMVPADAEGVADALSKERERRSGVDEYRHSDRKILTLETNINRRAEDWNFEIRTLEDIFFPVREDLEFGLTAQRRS